MDNLRLGVEWDINDAQLNASMNNARKQITSANQSVEKLETQVNGSIKTIATGVAGMLSIGAAQSFVKEMTRVRGEFQQIEVAYTTMLRSRTAADKLMAESVNLAAKTPFGLMDVANSTKQLIAYGFEAKNVTSTIEMLGNVAAGVGSNIGDISYLYGTLKTQGRAFQQDINQFTNRGIPIIAELAKQFGIAQSEVKKLVEEGKVGFPDVEKAFKSLTGEAGIFHDLMRAQSKTLTGQLANLGDAWDSMLNNIGRSNEGLLASGISTATDLVENYEKVIEVIEQLIIVYGAYKAATIVTTIIEQTNALGSLSAALKSATGAQTLFNLVGKANPVGLIVGGITAAVSAFYLYKQSVSGATSATSSIQSEMNKAVFSADSLFSSLKKAKQGTEEHAGAIKLVNERYGKYLTNLLTNKSTLVEIEAAQKRVTSALLADIAVRSSQSKIEETLGDYTNDLESAFDRYAKAFEKSKGADRLGEFWKGLNDSMDKSLEGSGTATQNAKKFAMEYLKDVGTIRYDIYDGTFATDFREIFKKRLNVDQTVNQLKAFADSFSKDLIQKVDDSVEDPVPVEVDKDAEKKEKERQKKLTDEFKKELEERMKAFDQYEDYKTRVSKEEADARFGNDIQGYNTFYDYVQAQMDTLLNGRDPMTLSGGEYERYDLLLQSAQDYRKKESDARNEAFAKEYEEEKEKYEKLLATLITYDQERKNKISEFENNKAKLLADGKTEEVAVLEQKHVEELAKLDDANIQKLDSYKKLFDGIEKLSDASARKVIADAKAMLLANKNLSAEEYKKIQDAIKEAEKSLSDRLPDRVLLMSDAFADMAQNIGRANEGLGSMLQGVSDVLRATVQVNDGFKNLKTGIANYKENKASGTSGGLGSISAIAGIAGSVSQIVGAVGSVVSGVVGFFKAAKESAKQAAAEIKAYQDSIIAGELEYNRLLRDRERSFKAVNEMTLSELAIQKELLETQLQSKELREITTTNQAKNLKELINGTNKVKSQEVLSDYEYALRRLQTEGTEITGQKKEKYGGFLGIGKKTRVVDVTASLAGKTYEDLEKLYTEGKMNDASKVLFENLQKAKEEVDDINELMKEIDELVMDKMSGGITAASISSSIISGFRDGKRAVTDFADSAEEIIQNALLSAMSATVLEEPLQELVKQFREDSKDGLSTEEIERFKTGYAAVVQSGLDALKEVDKITGGAGGKGQSGLAGSIDKITSQQADVLAGQIGGMRLAQLYTNEILSKNLEAQSSTFRESLLVQIGIEANTQQTAKNTNRLEKIENTLISMDKKMTNDTALRAGGNR